MAKSPRTRAFGRESERLPPARAGTPDPKAPRSPPARGDRHRRPALGNDPFERGAAPREPVATSTSTSIPASEPPASPTPTPIPVPTPDPAPEPTPGPRPERSAVASRQATAGLAALEAEARLVVAKLLPALRARLGTVAELVRLLEPPARLDRYGLDARFAERLEPVIDFFYSTWWRVQVRSISAVPAEGPALVVANHAGVVPWDAFVLRHALRRDHPHHRDLRPLLDDEACAVPIFGAAAVRAGAVRATPEAAGRILGGGGLLGVFPEGSAGARKPWRDRYSVVRFGRGGFAKVAIRASAPIVPCAIIGSEEASAGISRTGWLAERLGVPLLAANPSLRIGAAALLPLPSRWTLRFGEPVETAGLGAGAADDPGAVNAIAERVRSAVQAMLDEGVASRTSVFL